MATELATLAGGCFWCLEAVFQQLRGVTKVVPGYTGGSVPNPSYQAVCTGDTGHAEVTQVTFDPAVIAYRDLLDVFFTIHDPTTLNRQGGDEGTQYRSGIFYHSRGRKRRPSGRSGSWKPRRYGTIRSSRRSCRSRRFIRRRATIRTTTLATPTSPTVAR